MTTGKHDLSLNRLVRACDQVEGKRDITITVAIGVFKSTRFVWLQVVKLVFISSFTLSR